MSQLQEDAEYLEKKIALTNCSHSDLSLIFPAHSNISSVDTV